MPDIDCPVCRGLTLEISAGSCKLCGKEGTIPDRRKPLANDRPDAPIIHAIVSLAAAISLLENSPKTGAPSNKMFDTMLDDYRKALEDARNYAREHIVQRSPTANDRAVERIKAMLETFIKNEKPWDEYVITARMVLEIIHEEEERHA